MASELAGGNPYAVQWLLAWSSVESAEGDPLWCPYGLLGDKCGKVSYKYPHSFRYHLMRKHHKSVVWTKMEYTCSDV